MVFQACHSTLGMLVHGCPQVPDAAMWNHTKDMFVSNSWKMVINRKDWGSPLPIPLTGVEFANNLAWNLSPPSSQDLGPHVLGDPGMEPSFRPQLFEE